MKRAAQSYSFRNKLQELARGSWAGLMRHLGGTWAALGRHLGGTWAALEVPPISGSGGGSAANTDEPLMLHTSFRVCLNVE